MNVLHQPGLGAVKQKSGSLLPVTRILPSKFSALPDNTEKIVPIDMLVSIFDEPSSGSSATP